MKLIQIVGARPQFIKYFPLQKVLEKEDNIKDILVHTGQHYDYQMSEVFFKQLGIKKPDYHLEVGSATQGVQTAKIIEKVEKVLIEEKPDFVIVYGDTNSTLGGALAAAKLHIPIIHIESGLRSYNKKMPEEINRVLTDHISSILLCPTKNACDNLKKEGFKNIAQKGKLISLDYKINNTEITSDNPLVINTGDIMYDAVILSLKAAKNHSTILKKLNIEPKTYSFMTLHRAENTDDPERLKEMINFVVAHSKTKEIYFPVHPRTAKIIKSQKIELPEKIKPLEPLDYFDTLTMLNNALELFTDSGGMQKEAYWLKVPTITLRDETEWVETVKSGWNVLYKDYNGSHKLKKQLPYFGDGKTAERIKKVLKSVEGER